MGPEWPEMHAGIVKCKKYSEAVGPSLLVLVECLNNEIAFITKDFLQQRQQQISLYNKEI